MDTKAWAKRQKKKDKARQANLAEAKRLEFEELDQQAEEEARLKEAYGEKDLSGLKVAHGADDFEEGRDVILTLKDSGVLADEGGSRRVFVNAHFLSVKRPADVCELHLLQTTNSKT